MTKFVFLPPNIMSLLQPMDQGVIRMFKTHYLQKTWRALSMKYDANLRKPLKLPWRLRWNARKTWCGVIGGACTIRDAIWHVQDAWKEVAESCICGAWKKLCPQYAVDFKGFDLIERLSEKCLKLTKKVRPGRARGKRRRFCWRRSAKSCRQRNLTNWRSNGISWRRRWRLSSSL